MGLSEAKTGARAEATAADQAAGSAPSGPRRKGTYHAFPGAVAKERPTRSQAKAGRLGVEGEEGRRQKRFREGGEGGLVADKGVVVRPVRGGLERRRFSRRLSGWIPVAIRSGFPKAVDCLRPPIAPGCRLGRRSAEERQVGDGRGGSATFHFPIGFSAEKSSRERIHLVLRAEGAEGAGVRLLAGEAVDGDGQGDVAPDGREEARHPRVPGAGGDLFAEFALEFGGVGDDGLHVAVLRDERRGGLLTDAPDAGDVVGAVAGEGEVVDHLRGACEPPVGADLGGAEDFGGGLADPVEEGARADELGDILVARHEVGVDVACRLGGGGIGAHEVVGFKAVGADNRDVHGGGERLGHGD